MDERLLVQLASTYGIRFTGETVDEQDEAFVLYELVSEEGKQEQVKVLLSNPCDSSMLD